MRVQTLSSAECAKMVSVLALHVQHRVEKVRRAGGGLSVSLMQTICLAVQHCWVGSVTGYYNTNRNLRV